jgi:hypothetical protein
LSFTLLLVFKSTFNMNWYGQAFNVFPWIWKNNFWLTLQPFFSVVKQ